MPATLSSVPEELLERILSLVIAEPPPPLVSRPTWHPYTPSANAAAEHPSRLAPLLVSRTFLRVATPLHYRSIVLRTPRQTSALAAVLAANPSLGSWVRDIRVEGTFDALTDVVKMCPRLESFDMTVDNGPSSNSTPTRGSEQASVGKDVIRFCESLEKMHTIKHLVVRKNAYLTQPGPTMVLEQLSKAISQWQSLETVNIAFRFSPSPASASFAASLASAPRLRTVSALLPAVWNTYLLDIAANPNLERIHLAPQSELAGSHLFLTEARKHPRLNELIRNGTPMFRGRAHTLASHSHSHMHQQHQHYQRPHSNTHYQGAGPIGLPRSLSIPQVVPMRRGVRVLVSPVERRRLPSAFDEHEESEVAPKKAFPVSEAQMPVPGPSRGGMGRRLSAAV